MELFLLHLVAIIRPLASMSYAAELFDVVGIGLFAILIVAMSANFALRQTIRISLIDSLILVFSLWCVAIYLIYLEYAYIRDVVKLIVPMLSYTVAKNVLASRLQYRNMLGWMIAGFSVPVLLSAALIMTGNGIDYVSYWTGLTRWQGAYEGSHSLGHSMTLFLIVLMLYTVTDKNESTDVVTLGVKRKIVLVLLASIALYCLYMSQVRSAILGLLTFSAIYLFFINRKVFIVGAVAFTVVAVILIPYWLPALLPEYAMRQKGIDVDTMDLGSGRPRFWLNDLYVFADLPVDRQLAGVGIGNRGEQSADAMLYGHNDWLELLLQTGLVGLALYAVLQVAMLRAILRVTGKERYAYLALFCALNLMMLVSNSFVWRIQVSQLYFIVYAFIELRNRTSPGSDSAIGMGHNRERDRLDHSYMDGHDRVRSI
jgi:O-antigen ligase